LFKFLNIDPCYLLVLGLSVPNNLWLWAFTQLLLICQFCLTTAILLIAGPATVLTLGSNWMKQSMRTFYQLIFMGVGTAIALCIPSQTFAQSTVPSSSLHSAARSPAGPAHPPLTLAKPWQAAVRLAQASPEAPLPSVSPGAPSPSPTEAVPGESEPGPQTRPVPGPSPSQQTTPPSPTPPAADPPETVPENLERLNPTLELLELPDRPEEVQVEFTQPITLQQALDLAARNNRELQVAELELRRSRSALREARADLYPNLGAQADLTRQGSGFSGSGQDNDNLPPELQQFSQNNTRTNLTGTLELNYDLFTSGRRAANIRAAEEQVRFDELEVERQREQLRLDITNSYYDIQQAGEEIRIAQAAVTNAQRSLQDAQALERAGLGTRFDVLRSQVQLANATQDLTQALSQLRIAQRQLAQQLSLPPNANIAAADPVAVAERWTLGLEETIIRAFDNRAELAQQLAQRDISRARRRIALAELGPQVSLFANYNVVSDLEEDLSPEDNYAVGARVGLNLFDGGAARARAAQEEANIEIAETQFANTRDQVRFQVEEAYNQLQSNFENIQTASVAVEQAEESLRLARLRFQAGVGTQLDVIEAETELTQAQSNQLQAILNYNRALAALERAVSVLPPGSPSQAAPTNQAPRNRAR